MMDASNDVALLKELQTREETTLWALRAAYNRKQIDHLFFGPAYDVTASRAAALSFAVAEAQTRDSDGSGEAGETHSGSTEGDSAGPQDIAQGDPS